MHVTCWILLIIFMFKIRSRLYTQIDRSWDFGEGGRERETKEKMKKKNRKRERNDVWVRV